jgi:WD40 repeat protein/DNA-binding XRE family transcriptional regulator
VDKKQVVSHPLRRERELRGWSRTYVAEQLGVDVMTVGRWERGERFPQPDHRQKLCALFEKNAQELALLPETPNTLDDQAVVSDRSPQISDNPLQPPDASLQTSDTLDISLPISSLTNEQGKGVSSSFHRHRRIFLTGLASLGAVALAGGIWEITHRSSPRSTIQPTVRRKPLFQLLDPNASNWINHLAYSPNGSMLAVACGDNVSPIWNIQESVVASYYHTLNQWINDISWSKGGFLAAANGSFSSGSIQVWKFPEEKALFTIQRNSSMWAVSWSPLGDLLAFAGHGTTLEVWNPFTARPVHHYTFSNPNLTGINRVQWSFDARYLASADDSGTVHVWEVATGKLITVYHGHKGRVMDIAWCPGEYRIASASTDKTAQVWDALSGRHIVTYAGHKDEVHGIDWSPDRKYIVSGGFDTTVQIWDALTGQHIATYAGQGTRPGARLLTVCWSANGKLIASGSQEQGIDVWQAPQ